jgi:hypothetical protein
LDTRHLALVTFAVLATLGCLMMGTVAVVIASLRIARFERLRPGSTGLFGDIVPLGYAALMLGMASTGIGFVVLVPASVWMLWTPKLARQGRITLGWLGVVSAFFVLHEFLQFAARH